MSLPSSLSFSFRDATKVIDMGFEPARVDWALKATRGKGLQPAMDHLVEHSEAPIPDNIGDDAEEDEDDEGIVPAGSTAAVSPALSCRLSLKM